MRKRVKDGMELFAIAEQKVTISVEATAEVESEF
jgi:hypothetical protein